MAIRREEERRSEEIMQRALSQLSQLQVTVEVLKVKLTRIEEEIALLVTRPEFTPVKLLTYGLAGSMLAGIVAAILSQLMHK